MPSPNGHVPLRAVGTDVPAVLSIPPGPWTEDVYTVVQDESWRARNKPDRPCVVPGCLHPSYLLSTRAADLPHGVGMCRGHSSRWVRAGRPAIETFLATQREYPLRHKDPVRLDAARKLSIEFNALPGPLAHELRFAIGSCMESRKWSPNPGLARQLRTIAETLSPSDCVSILEESRESWSVRLAHVSRTQMGFAERHVRETVGCFMTIYEVLVDAYTRDPWEGDEWKTALLGFHAAHRQSIHWESVTIPWLKDGLKALARVQLSVNARKWTTVETWRRAATSFCEYIEIRGMGDLEKNKLDRHLILDFFASMSSDSARSRARVLVQLLYDLRRYEIVTDLPDVIYLMPGEAVVKKTRSPRPYPPDVIERIDQLILESEFLYLTERRILKLLRFGGPRPSEALRLPLDSLRVTAGGKYWIEYHQSKVEEMRKFPILRSLGLEMKEQQEMVRTLYGPDAEFMFPSKKFSIPATGGRGGKTVAISYSGFRKRMCSTFEKHGITSSEMTGERITGGELHRYRHTLATEMINDGWSLYQIQKFLGHVSSTMTQAYAELHDDTLDRLYRELMESAVDKDGNKAVEGEGFDHSVERMREHVAKAALPNGFCDLPESKPCDFRPTPCLECSFFRTTPVFLDTHRRQRDELKLIVQEGERRGNVRIVELNRPTLERVEKLITGLESADMGTDAGNHGL